MEYLNKIEIKGLINEIKITQVCNTCVVRLSVEVRDYYSNNGGSIAKTTFIPVVAWESDNCPNLSKLQKGDNIHVQGRLEVESFLDQNGNTKTYFQTRANKLKMI